MNELERKIAGDMGPKGSNTSTGTSFATGLALTTAGVLGVAFIVAMAASVRQKESRDAALDLVCRTGARQLDPQLVHAERDQDVQPWVSRGAHACRASDGRGGWTLFVVNEDGRARRHGL